MGKNPDWLKIGIVGKPLGLKGDFFVTNRQDPIPLIYSEIVIGDDPVNGIKTTIKKSLFTKDTPVLNCSLADSRTEIEKYRNKPLWVHRSRIKIKAEEEYLWHDILGRVIFDPGNIRLGNVKEIYNTGANDILLIENDEGKRLELPYIDLYFEMNFEENTGALRLKVPQETFSGLWYTE